MQPTINEQEILTKDVTPLLLVKGPTWNMYVFADENDDVWLQLDDGVQVNVAIVRSLLLALEYEEFEQELQNLLVKYNALPEQLAYKLEG